MLVQARETVEDRAFAYVGVPGEDYFCCFIQFSLPPIPEITRIREAVVSRRTITLPLIIYAAPPPKADVSIGLIFSPGVKPRSSRRRLTLGSSEGESDAIVPQPIREVSGILVRDAGSSFDEAWGEEDGSVRAGALFMEGDFFDLCGAAAGGVVMFLSIFMPFRLNLFSYL